VSRSEILETVFYQRLNEGDELTALKGNLRRSLEARSLNELVAGRHEREDSETNSYVEDLKVRRGAN